MQERTPTVEAEEYTAWVKSAKLYNGELTVQAELEAQLAHLPRQEVARKSIERKTGARGLRAIMENIMMDTMFTVPSDKTIKECRITKEAVLGVEEPKYTRDSEDRKSFLTSESK